MTGRRTKNSPILSKTSALLSKIGQINRQRFLKAKNCARSGHTVTVTGPRPPDPPARRPLLRLPEEVLLLDGQRGPRRAAAAFRKGDVFVTRHSGQIEIGKIVLTKERSRHPPPPPKKNGNDCSHFELFARAQL
jgi:hypothetical protein